MSDNKVVSIEELLFPRYKVIAPYPGSPFTVNTILVPWANNSFWHEEGMFGKPDLPMTNNPNDYPHLFKPLQWWEKRKPEEMPEYLKIIAKTINRVSCYGEIFKAIPGEFRSWAHHTGFMIENGFVKAFDGILIECFYPATLEEYNAFLESKK